MDHGAGTPVDTRVIDEMIPVLTNICGNPQSPHEYGSDAHEVLDTARKQVASLINADIGEIYFTASGTESNNMALKGIARAYKRKGMHIVISAIEHQSVIYSIKALEKEGFTVTSVPVNSDGLVDPEAVVAALTDTTILVSVMLANGEVGTLQPIKAIAEKVKERGIIIHTDAVDAVGVIPVDVADLGVDALSLAGTQFYGPKGAAALYLKKGTRLIPVTDGGIQEEGRRAGTENVTGIVGLGKSAELARVEMEKRAATVSILRDRLVEGLQEGIKHLHYTGHPTSRLPHHASFCVEFIEGEAMLLTLSMKGVAASSGSACTSRALKASHVLDAMGIDIAVAQGSLVFTLGSATSAEDVEYVIAEFPPIVERLRAMSPLYTKFKKDQK